MNFFSTSNVKILDDSKNPGAAPKIATLEEIKAYASNLTYALPHLIDSFKGGRIMRGKRKGKGKRAKESGELVKMPDPRHASALNKVYNIIQTVNSGGTVISSTTIEVLGAKFVIFANFAQKTEFAAVFDQYRIAMVEITFMPRATMIDGSNINTDPNRFCSAVDRDDSASPSSFDALAGYPGVVFTEAIKEHKHTFVPHVAVAVYSGAFTSFANEAAPWIDCSSDSVQHYGVKYGFQITPITRTYDYKVRAWFQFRAVR